MLKILANFLMLGIAIANLTATSEILRHKRRDLVCGVPHQEVGLIVGGGMIKPGDFPW